MTLSNVRRGVTQAAALGYWIGLRHARKGHMRAALVCAGARSPSAVFGCIVSRRLACPITQASIRTLEGAGFRREGLARTLPQDQRHVAGPRAVCAVGGGSGAGESPAHDRPLFVTLLCARTRRVSAACCVRSCLASIGTASALTPIEVTPDQERIDITTVGEVYEGRRDNLQVETAPGRRWRHRPHVRTCRDRRHESELDRLRAAQLDRQAHRAMAYGRALQRRRFRRRLAGSRCAPHRGRDAVRRLPARPRQERSRRHLPPDHRARPDHHLRRRAGLRPLLAHSSVEGARVRAEVARPPAVQRHPARYHRPAGRVPDGRVRRQPQGHLPGRRAGDMVRAGPALRRLRLLAQAVPDAARGQRAVSRRRGSRGGRQPGDLPLHVSARDAVARLRAHAVSGVDRGSARHHRHRHSGPAPRRHRGAHVHGRHRRRRRRVSRFSCPCAGWIARWRWRPRGSSSWSGCSAPA